MVAASNVFCCVLDDAIDANLLVEAKPQLNNRSFTFLLLYKSC